MKLKIYKSLWGMGGSIEEQFSHIAAAGYHGVESAVEEISDRENFKVLLREYKLEYIPLIYTEEPSPPAQNCRRLVKLASEFEPRKIIAHAGRDIWSFEEQIDFFKE